MVGIVAFAGTGDTVESEDTVGIAGIAAMFVFVFVIAGRTG